MNEQYQDANGIVNLIEKLNMESEINATLQTINELLKARGGTASLNIQFKMKWNTKYTDPVVDIEYEIIAKEPKKQRNATSMFLNRNNELIFSPETQVGMDFDMERVDQDTGEVVSIK